MSGVIKPVRRATKRPLRLMGLLLGLRQPSEYQPGTGGSIEVWQWTRPKYRLRAFILLLINALLFAGLGAFALWLRTGRYFAASGDAYWNAWWEAFDPTREQQLTLLDYLTYPIPVSQVPLMMVIIGLVMASLTAIPILVSMLYRLPYAIIFTAIICFVAMLPWLAATVTFCCILARWRPLQFSFHYATALIALLPVISYYALATRNASVSQVLPPVELAKLYVPWVLAVVAALASILTTAALGCTTFLRNRDYQTPRRIWLDAVAKRPDNYAALQNLVAVFLHEGDYQQALKTSERVLQLKPDFPEAYSARGSAYGHLGDFNRAIEECTRAIELKPSLADAYSNRSNAYAGLRDYERAVADCTKAIELKPDFAEAYVNRAVAHGGARRYAEAIADCTKAIELDANCAEAYNNRGISYAAIRDYDRAIADYHLAIKIRPDYSRTYYNLAVAQYYLKQYSAARANIEKCRQLGGTMNPAFLDAMKRAETRPTEGR